MRQSTFLTIAIALITSVFGVFLPAPDVKDTDIRGKSAHVFQVVVVGGTTTTDGNAKVGSDVWEGASAFAGGKDLGFDLVGLNDENLPSTASKIAKDLERNPRVLAVIGHSISLTSRSAAEIYADAGIPFVLPVATAQSAVYPTGVDDDHLDDSTQRLENTFRLRPSDDRAQAPAISYLVSSIAAWKTSKSILRSPRAMKVHIVLATDAGASPYSKPLGNAIQRLLTEAGFAPDKVSTIEGSTIDQLTRELVADHDQADTIIFCGYSTQANAFLTALSTAYKSSNKTAPTLVFSEASLQIEKAGGPELIIYRTAPEDIGRCTLPADLHSSSPVPSAEFISGYDAVHLVSVAVQRCQTDVSRICVLRQLQEAAALPGACRGYSFRQGESVLSSYYVFRSSNAPDVTTATFQLAASTPSIVQSSEITPGQIIDLQASGVSTYGHH